MAAIMSWLFIGVILDGESTTKAGSAKMGRGLFL
jgi:hypothetical protein